MYKKDNFIDENKKILDPSNGGFAFTVMMAGYFIISFLGGALLNAVTEVGSIVYYAVAPLFSTLIFLLIIAYYKKTSKARTVEFYSINKSKPIYLIVVLLFAIGMLLGLGSINGFIARLVVKLGGSVSSSNIPLDSFFHLILFTIVLAILPACFEELFFRSFVLGVTLKKVNPAKAILLSSMLFALYHTQITQLIYQFVYGVILGLLFYKSKSVIWSFLLHFLNNFAVLLLGYLKVEINFYNPITISLGLIAVVLALLVTLVIDKKTKSDNESAKGLLFPYGIFGIALCLLVIVVNVVA